jgi:hypothetical protein
MSSLKKAFDKLESEKSQRCAITHAADCKHCIKQAGLAAENHRLSSQ